jgi:hypothetical protein
MKALRLVGLGILIWGLSLLWPEVNQVLTPWLTIGITFGLGALTLAYIFIQRLGHRHNGGDAGQDHRSRPIPVVVTH